MAQLATHIFTDDPLFLSRVLYLIFVTRNNILVDSKVDKKIDDLLVNK